jgi:hypothetical protein
MDHTPHEQPVVQRAQKSLTRAWPHIRDAHTGLGYAELSPAQPLENGQDAP